MVARIALLFDDRAATPEVMERATAAHQQFLGLPRELQSRLVLAASRHNIVLRLLAIGDWDSLTATLLSLNVTYPNRGYSTLATELNPHVIHALSQ